MSVRRIVAQQLGRILKLPFADLDHLDEPIGDARLNGVDLIVLNPYTKDAATFEPVRGECEADETETIACRCYGDPHGKAVYHIHVMECTECGHTYEHVNGDYEYCPRCGRKRRDFVE